MVFAKNIKKPLNFTVSQTWFNNKTEVCSVCGLFGEHKSHNLIMKKDLPGKIKQTTDELSETLKKLIVAQDFKKAKTLSEYVNQKFKESADDKKKQLTLIYKQVKNIIKQTIFDFVDQYQKNCTQAINSTFNDENQDFLDFKSNHKKIELKLAEIKKKLLEKSPNNTKIFLELEKIKSKMESIKSADIVFDAFSNNCCYFQLEMDLNLNKINDIFVFRTCENFDELLKIHKQQIEDLSKEKPKPLILTELKKPTEMLNELDIDVSFSPSLIKFNPSYNFDSDSSNLKFDPPTETKKHSFKFKKPHLELDLGSDESQPISKKQVFLTNIGTNGGGAKTVTENNISQINPNLIYTPNSNFYSRFPTKMSLLPSKNELREYEESFDIMLDKGPSFLTNKNPMTGSDRKNSIRNQLYSVKDGVVLIAHNYLSDQKLHEILTHIFEENQYISKIEFRKNTFLNTNPISLMIEFFDQPVSKRLFVDLKDNKFTKTCPVEKNALSSLAKKNIIVQI